MAFSVLVVEDDAAVSALLTELLTEQGYAVEQAGDGIEALAALASHVPDAILLDLLLPGLDGRELLRRRQAAPAWAQVPVLVLSGAPRSVVEATPSTGPTLYLAKPF